MTPKQIGPEIPSPQDLSAFAKEYYKSYMDAVEEKKPQVYPKFAQEAPYNIQSILLPNGSVAMIFTSAQELKIDGSERDWDQVQEMIVKGVDHFSGFFPFEGRSLGDWNKRGKRDALRDLRLLERSELGKNGAELEMLIDNITKMVKANPWLGKSGTEMTSTLRSMEGRMKSGFPTVDAIATLQSLKSYVPGSESVTIEFPEKELLEDIAEGIKGFANLEEKIDTVENRMFEIEKLANSPEYASKVTELADRVDRLEKQLEKVSNILTMLNSKVETYFSKSAEKERQADLERRIEEHTGKALSHESKISELEKEAESLVQEMRKMTTKMDKDLQDSRKRIARMEKHFVDLAKMIQE
ncbi:MAG TPA: hypothetical protein VJ489_00570 [Thermoplasmata archaeon]|nr:hypothetical protein [Thermoplasmata archaeon]